MTKAVNKILAEAVADNPLNVKIAVQEELDRRLQLAIEQKIAAMYEAKESDEDEDEEDESDSDEEEENDDIDEEDESDSDEEEENDEDEDEDDK